MSADAEEVGEEVLGRLEYLNATIMEGLRLHPTMPMVLRKVRELVLLINQSKVSK